MSCHKGGVSLLKGPLLHTWIFTEIYEWEINFTLTYTIIQLIVHCLGMWTTVAWSYEKQTENSYAYQQLLHFKDLQHGYSTFLTTKRANCVRLEIGREWWLENYSQQKIFFSNSQFQFQQSSSHRQVIGK